ncbi:MAG: hypothetical protein IPN34_19070 [Planctomycetes bacterium]|nr:hypothetical protein [Planctomycetota bacterium]
MEPDEIEAARRRAGSRRSWPVRIFRLGAEPSEDLSATTTAEERLAMVEELSRQAWELSGRPWPSYTRAEIPVRIFRPGEPRDP